MSTGSEPTLFEVGTDQIPADPGPRVPRAAPRGATLTDPSLLTAHWRATQLQLVNWGGFEGRHILDIADGSTLISGATGTGKSTLQDAYIALMMPYDVAFNGASNAALAGRARSADQRNLVSYLRGKTDTVQMSLLASDGTEQLETSDKVLRGDGKPTWGAIAAMFTSDLGHIYTAMRAYWVPASARQAGDITMRLFTVEGPADLSLLEQCANVDDKHFPTDLLKAQYGPSLRGFGDHYDGFSQSMHTRLGIGSGGNGANAMRLLARIQAGQQIRTVDALYKDLVLEQPDTFDIADKAIEHFDDLEVAYDAMVTESQKQALLSPITTLFTEREAARAALTALDTIGLARAGDTPYLLWRTRTHADLFQKAIDVNRADADRTRTLLAGMLVEETLAETALKGAEAAYLAAGGADLVQIDEQIQAFAAEQGRRKISYDILSDNVAVLDVPLDTQADFETLAAAAAAFLASLPGTRRRLQDERDRLRDGLSPLTAQIQDLDRELKSLDGRKGRIPDALHRKRVEAATVSGIPVSDLPFVAELVDVPDHENRWRTAIETVLYGIGTTLLVPAERLEQFTQAINDLQWHGRVRYTAVSRSNAVAGPHDPARIAGKLVYADSPYSPWVHNRLSRPDLNALCVQSPADLRGDGLRVTATGQTRSGNDGAHGRVTTANILGFGNADLVEEYTSRKAALESELRKLLEQVQRIDDQVGTLGTFERAYLALRGITWDNIDFRTPAEQITKLEQDKDRLEHADDKLAEAAAQRDARRTEREDLRRRHYGLDERAKELEETWSALCPGQDEVKAALWRLEDAVTLSDEQSARLDAAFATAVTLGRQDSLDDFTAHTLRMRSTLQEEQKSLRDRFDRNGRQLEDVFKAYKLKWDDPNLGVSVDAYPEYAEILENIESTGLHERRGEWRRRVVEWSGDDLVPLRHALTAGVEDIEYRIDAINEILRRLPFGATGDQLQIKSRRLARRANLAVFARELADVAAMSTMTLADDQIESRFVQLRTLIAKVRRSNDERLPKDLADTSDRENLLDVRRHVTITAHRLSPTGELLSTHSYLSDKSGGETQELVAFIVGAALRYRLGDSASQKPRFTPVFLDEGFVKSDSEFAGRAVRAWQGLGFQLIVAAPLDKVSALESHVQRICVVTKNQSSGYSFIDALHDAPAQVGS